MKTILTALLLSISISVFSQKNDVDKQLQKMTEAVSLTKEQQTKYKTYLINRDKEKEQLMSKFKDDSGSQAKKDAQEAFQVKYNTELKKILTAEQWAKLEEIKKSKQQGK